MFSRYMDTRDHMGKVVKLGEDELTPISRATIVQIPGVNGGLVWNRPTGVLVKMSDDREAVLPIRDITRIAQIALLAIGFIGGLGAWFLLRRND